MEDVVHLHIKKHHTFAESFRWTDDLGYPVNMSEMVITMTIRETYDSPIIAQIDSGDIGGVTVTVAEGRIDTVFTPDETSELDFVNAVFDVSALSENGEKTVIADGYITLDSTVTYD